MPDLPAGSSAAPTRYHSMCVTTGVRRSGMTTTTKPLARVNCVTDGAAMLSCGVVASAAQMASAEIMRINGGTGALKAPVPGTDDRSGRSKTVKRNRALLFFSDRTVEDCRDLEPAAPV